MERWELTLCNLQRANLSKESEREIVCVWVSVSNIGVIQNLARSMKDVSLCLASYKIFTNSIAGHKITKKQMYTFLF